MQHRYLLIALLLGLTLAGCKHPATTHTNQAAPRRAAARASIDTLAIKADTPATDTLLTDTLSTDTVAIPAPIVIEHAWQTARIVSDIQATMPGMGSLSARTIVSHIADSIIVLSLQPLLGIEVLRCELLPAEARVLDKLHRRYAVTDYETLSHDAGEPVTFQTMEQLTEAIGNSGLQQVPIEQSGIKANIVLRSVTTNQPVSARALSTAGYQRMEMETLIRTTL